jgi:transposase
VRVEDATGSNDKDRRFTFTSPASRERLLDHIASLGRVQVAVEALGLNRWFVNGLQARGLRVGTDVIVVHAAKLRLRESGKKTDRRDARELARRLRLGDLEKECKSYYATDTEYDTRRLVRTRRHLVATRQRCIGLLRAAFRTYALSMPSGQLWTEKNLAWLDQHVNSLPAGSFASQSAVAMLRGVQAEIKRLEKEIARRARRDPRAWALVEEIPQLAELTALTLVVELGDLTRFTSTRAVAAYPGLVPAVNDSGSVHRHGRLTKAGNRHLRWILGQLAVRLMTTNKLVRRWAAPQRRRRHQNTIRTALARRLLIGIYRSQVRREPFSLERCLGMKQPQ